MKGRILIACVGNIFLGDDAFGVEVARRLSNEELPEHVVVKDFGIRSYDLAYALMENWDLSILVDAVSQGGEPGTVYVIEPDTTSIAKHEVSLDAHSMNPVSVIQLVHELGGGVGRMLVVGCEPATIDDNGQFGLSEPAQAAVAEAVTAIKDLVATNNRATAA